MKSVLAFGDSNTWGLIPGKRKDILGKKVDRDFTRQVRDCAHNRGRVMQIRQVEKTKVDESAKNIFYIVQGNEATDDALLHETARKIIDTTVKYCGGSGYIVKPEAI